MTVARSQTPPRDAPTPQVSGGRISRGGTGVHSPILEPSWGRRPSVDAMGAARAYLRGIEGWRESSYRTPADRRALAETLRETAQIMEALGLVERYLPTTSRWTRKRRAYRETTS